MDMRVFYQDRTRKVLFLVMIAVFLSLNTGCETARLMPLIQLDTPHHHTFAGLKLVDQGKYAEAQKAFELALQSNNHYSKAYTGLGLVKTYASDFKGAQDHFEKGRRYAGSDEERFLSHVSLIRFHTQSQQEPDWLEKSQDEFKAAVKIDPQNVSAYYFMGLAFKQACRFDSAGEMFAKASAFRSDYLAEAGRESDFIRKVQRAMPVSTAGRRIALVESMTRADAALLLMEELKIDALYSGEVPAHAGDSFGKKAFVRTTARDIAGHPLKKDIEGVLQVGIRGLGNDPEGNFRPDSSLSRAEFALILEGIMTRITGDRSLNQRFVGSRSPFSDVPNSSPYFNAAMVVTTRGLMICKNEMNGEFAPYKPLTGVDALLSVRVLKDKWNYQ